MIKLFLSSILVCVVSICLLQPALSSISKKLSNPPSVFSTLNWFPEDIETLVVFRDFEVPNVYEESEFDELEECKRNVTKIFKLPDSEGALRRNFKVPKKQEITEARICRLAFYRTAVLPLICSEMEGLYKLLVGQKVILSVGVSKNFRFPGGEGTNKYDGCHILWFKDPIPRSFLFGLQKAGSAFEYKGHKVRSIPVQWSSQDQKTAIYITLSGDNVLLVATDKMFLQIVLDRMDSKKSRARKALPPSLPEWKYIDTNKKYWSLRHVSESSKAETRKVYVLDGVVAQLNDSAVSSITVGVLCRDEQSIKAILQLNWEDEVNRYPLVKKEADHLWTLRPKPKSGEDFLIFEFMLDSLLGHTVYI